MVYGVYGRCIYIYYGLYTNKHNCGGSKKVDCPEVYHNRIPAAAR